MYKDDYCFPQFMYSALFWTGDTSKIISLEDIKKFNTEVKCKVSSLYSFDTEKQFISREELLSCIKSYELPSKEMYDSNGALVSNDFYTEIVHNTNIDKIKDLNLIKYGMSINKISVRSFPTESAIFISLRDSNINNFDRFQETGCFACEPLLILHESYDKKWYFVKLYNYFGWAKVDDISLASSKSQILDYVNSKDFLVITGKEAALTIDGKEDSPSILKLGMGTKLCLLKQNEQHSQEYYTVKFPVRDTNGILSFKKAFINKDENITKGYLPYTRYNIINQALKYIDTPYDWGDKFYGKDCSSFIMTIFRCFGFLLPRNAGEQEKSFLNADNSIVFNKEDTIETRYSKMGKLKPGAALFMSGHVMMYLGKYDGTHYMIHSFLGYGVKNSTSYEARTALCVAISPVTMPTSDGIPFMQKFTSGVHFQ